MSISSGSDEQSLGVSLQDSVSSDMHRCRLGRCMGVVVVVVAAAAGIAGFGLGDWAATSISPRSSQRWSLFIWNGLAVSLLSDQSRTWSGLWFGFILSGKSCSMVDVDAIMMYVLLRIVIGGREYWWENFYEWRIMPMMKILCTKCLWLYAFMTFVYVCVAKDWQSFKGNWVDVDK